MIRVLIRGCTNSRVFAACKSSKDQDRFTINNPLCPYIYIYILEIIPAITYLEISIVSISEMHPIYPCLNSSIFKVYFFYLIRLFKMKQNIRIFKLYLQILLHYYFFWIQKGEFILTCDFIPIDVFKYSVDIHRYI